MPERTQIAFKLISSHIILLPVLILSSLFTGLNGFLTISVVQTILLILYFSGYWEFFGLRTRIIYSALMELLLLAELIFILIAPSSGITNRYLLGSLLIIEAYLLFELVKIIIVILNKESADVEIAFPFRNGKYLITDGGNSRISRLMNYHFFSSVHKKNRTSNSMLFATDIVKIADSGRKFLPAGNEDFAIFGESVISPVSGIVSRVIENIDDNIPWSGGYPYNTGNTVVIQTNNCFLLLGHLRKGSIKVKVGDKVEANDLVGEAGNSGYSERPHLHMQLIESTIGDYWKGRGVSIQFRKKNLYKNRVIEV